jgi:predicted metal-dependent TIM-barrel fold hydrolase
MQSLKGNPKFGLASNDPEGRQAAIRFMERVKQAVYTLNDKMGKNAVIAVELATAPRRSPQRTESSSLALQQSLEVIASWNWDESLLVIEHCDAQVPEHLLEKKFLSLEEEVQA